MNEADETADNDNLYSLSGKISGDDSSIEPGDELPNGEILHCTFPGCMKGNT